METLSQHIKLAATRKLIFVTGFVAATLDVIAAIVIYKADPINLFKYIASGAVGREMAFSGSNLYAVLGILFHYVIAYTWTILYVILFPGVKKLPGNRYVNGVLYGVVIWVGMNLLVLPLSAIQQRAFNWGQAFTGIAIIIFAVGLPITILVHRHFGIK